MGGFGGAQDVLSFLLQLKGYCPVGPDIWLLTRKGDSLCHNPQPVFSLLLDGSMPHGGQRGLWV